MKTILVTGGTDGIGKGLATYLLKKGNYVIVVGNTAQKGDLFYNEAKQLGVEDRFAFLQANLSLVEENQRIITEVNSRFPSLDILILSAQAQKYRKNISITEEGFELSFALYYLSRYILSYGLKSALKKVENPMIVNICAPGVNGAIHWNDLQYTRQKNFNSIKAIMHGSRLNDLLGVAFAKQDLEKQIKYILYNPGAVQTTGAIHAFDQPIMQLISKLIYKIIGKPVNAAIDPIIELLENPPPSSLSAFKQRKQVNLTMKTFNRDNADKLFNLSNELIRKITGEKNNLHN